MTKPRRAARCARSGTPPGRRSTSRRCKSLLALHPESAACDLRAAPVCCCRKPKEAKNLDSLRQASHAAVHKHHGADDHGSREEHVERSEEHTSELQSLTNLVCRLLLAQKKKAT